MVLYKACVSVDRVMPNGLRRTVVHCARRVHACAMVCERERERENVCVCVCACVLSPHGCSVPGFNALPFGCHCCFHGARNASPICVGGVAISGFWCDIYFFNLLVQ